MTRKLNGFNRISWAYDTLNTLVFGGSIARAQTVFLKCIPQNAGVLILGGGSGLLLNELIRMNPGCKICFVDASSDMIRRARRNLQTPSKEHVEFIHGTTLDIPDRTFDAVITNFFLDIFSKKSLETDLPRIHKALKNDGVWLVSDFVDQGKRWHRHLLKVMYLFFKATARIEATALPPWEQMLDELKLERVQTEMFFGNFIKCDLYRNINASPGNPSQSAGRDLPFPPLT